MDLPLYLTALVAFLVINGMLLSASLLVYAARLRDRLHELKEKQLALG